MRKLCKRIVLCLLLAAFVWCGALLSDRRQLQQELIRLHVVANSDSTYDQQIKLEVRDAVLCSLESALAEVRDIEAAEAYLRENLEKLETVANQTLQKLGCGDSAVVTLCREAFDTRYYDTFTLPAGVYKALRITIGEGTGQNWWCVAFPALCLPATSEGFTEAAACAGFGEQLRNTLAGEESCEFRFYLLDALGKLENILFVG